MPCRSSPLLGRFVCRELPYDPQVVESLQSAQGIGIAVGGFKYDASLQLFNNPALAGYAELRGEGTAEVGDGGDGHVLLSKQILNCQ